MSHSRGDNCRRNIRRSNDRSRVLKRPLSVVALPDPRVWR